MRTFRIVTGDIVVGEWKMSPPEEEDNEDSEVSVEPRWKCLVTRRLKKCDKFVDKLRHVQAISGDKEACVVLDRGRYRFDDPSAWRTRSPKNMWIPFGFTSVIQVSKRFSVSFRIREDKGTHRPRYFFICYDHLNKTGKPWVIVDSKTPTRGAYLSFWESCSKHFGEDFTAAAAHISRRDSCFKTFGLETVEMEERCRRYEELFCGRNREDPQQTAVTLLHLKRTAKFFPLVGKDVFAMIARHMIE